MSTFVFDINKYLGTWYELVHYPSWFQRNDNYNTMAHYSLNCDNDIVVHNSSISKGKTFDSYGIAKRLGPYSLRVDFPMNEIQKLQKSREFNMDMSMINKFMLSPNLPNYVIDKIWYNNHGEYMFAVVTDPSRQSLYVLSRCKHPALADYNGIMEYVVANYDRDRLVQTPHYD